jgi:hypothetical protein
MGFLVADVCGHGVPAALVASMITTLRARSTSGAAEASSGCQNGAATGVPRSRLAFLKSG